ncbi:hypothetical protein FKP32DRAFT_1612992 [Trametes sanguinea]|nr:hypothetical protein FKP32DRAFT_1612992 [Trametes sanguinea]
MECPNCELRQRQFYCENCLKQHLLTFRLQTQHAAADRDAHIAAAQKALSTVVDPARLRRAELKGREERVQEIWDGVHQVRTTNEKLRERIQTLRSTLSTRRRTLAIATSTFIYPHASTSTPSTSASPPHAPVSSPQSGRPLSAGRAASSISSHSPSPTPSSASPVPRPLASSSRPVSTGYFSTSPQAIRSPFSLNSTPPQSYARPSVLAGHGRVVSTPAPGSAPYGTQLSTRGVDPLARQIEELQAQLAALSDTIARARSGLVQELVEVFSVVEVGGRPPLGGKAGTKGEWTIGGLVLPVPGDIRRYPPDHINAVLTHTIHFVTLLAFYLGVKLPFEIVSSLTDSHLTHSPAPAPSLSASPGSAFTTALAMLLYNVCYLAHTQAVDVPLAHAGDVLGNLWAVCCSPELGRRAHATRPLLPPPTPPAFGLDFSQLLQATAATPARVRARGTSGKEVRRTERIVEEEDGWDLLDEDLIE